MAEMVGQPNAFRFDIDSAVRQYADMVYRLAVLNAGSEQDAEDAFQEVFLKLFRHKDSIQSEEHLKAWLIRAAPQNAEDYSEVYDAVKTLPDKYRQVIHLFYYEQLSIHQIAQALDRNEATVKTHLARGRSLLKEKLKGNYS